MVDKLAMECLLWLHAAVLLYRKTLSILDLTQRKLLVVDSASPKQVNNIIINPFQVIFILIHRQFSAIV